MEERCIIDTDEKWVEILLSSVIIRNSNLHLGAVIISPGKESKAFKKRSVLGEL